jgi:hypothetical protein
VLSCPLAQVVAAVGRQGAKGEVVVWTACAGGIRGQGKKKTKRCASPTWGPLPEEFESMGGGAPVLPRIPQYAADPVDYLFCGGDWRSGTPITMFGVSIRDPGLEAKIIM